MRFAVPEALWLLLLLPVWGLALVVGRARWRRTLERLAGGPRLVPHLTREINPHRRAVKQLLILVGVALLIVSLARPQWGTRLETVTRRSGDIVVLLDTSLSMAAEDLPPNRLDHARHAIGALLPHVVGDRVALVNFAGEATITCPLTVDHAAIRLFLDATDVQAVTVPGTALADALQAAVLAFGPAEGRIRDRSVLLFTDGEDHQGELDDPIAALKSAGITVFAIGCGNARGAPIPVRDPTGALVEYKKDRQGRLVTTRLDESALERVALATGGRYYRATPTDAEVTQLAEALAGLGGEAEAGAVLRTRYEERFQIPLAIGGLALAIEALLGDRRKRARKAA